MSALGIITVLRQCACGQVARGSGAYSHKKAVVIATCPGGHRSLVELGPDEIHLAPVVRPGEPTDGAAVYKLPDSVLAEATAQDWAQWLKLASEAK